MKKTLAAIFCLLLGASGEAYKAAGGGSARPAERDAAPIVRALETRYHAANTLKASFLERYSEGRQDVRMESGTVYFRRPGRMRWEYESPEEKLFIADGRTVWFYVPADRTVTRARMKESADWRTPLALLTGKAKLSRLCGRIELAEERPFAAGHVVLRCLPRGEAARARPQGPGDALSPEENGPFQEVLLEVDAGRSELLRVLIRQSGGVEIEYRFANWQQNLPLPENLFRFRARAGVAIVDEASLHGPAR